MSLLLYVYVYFILDPFYEMERSSPFTKKLHVSFIAMIEYARHLFSSVKYAFNFIRSAFAYNKNEGNKKQSFYAL